MGQIEKVIGRKEYKVRLADDHYCNAPADLLIGGNDDVVGDKFVPNINMVKWDDEAWFNINHPILINDEVETFEDGVITLVWGNIIIKYYAIIYSTLAANLIYYLLSLFLLLFLYMSFQLMLLSFAL